MRLVFFAFKSLLPITFKADVAFLRAKEVIDRPSAFLEAAFDGSGESLICCSSRIGRIHGAVRRELLRE